MPRAKRTEQFVAQEVCVVHVAQRCVRRAFLAGADPVSGCDYSYRKEWIRRRMEALASAFGIDVLSYAIMSNHLHLILRNRPDVVASWADEEAAIRWLKVFPGRRLEEHLGEPTEAEVQRLCRDKPRLQEIRNRLSDISWFMRALAEPIARMANRQDDCTGRFWEGRFKAQRIVDEAGLLACSLYVDLNPVRAAVGDSPDCVPHTSAYDRIEAAKGKQINSAAFDLQPVPVSDASGQSLEVPAEKLRRAKKAKQRSSSGRRIRRDAWLANLSLDAGKLANDPEVHREGLRCSNSGYLNLSLREYMRLLRWTASAGRESMRGRQSVPKDVARALRHRGIEAEMWSELVWNWQRYFGRSGCAGSPKAMKADAENSGRRWYRGQGAVAAFFC
ncbi:transposase [Crateriforma conspicua]|uniref:Transposase IS200-like domain-containing protein n=1 Tax=Crateriforma conspicua TaxID=2527996 RepID=A0A5C5Y1H3_9PLAN|nr:transposase [Crateriforma conspicua]TWT69596.1 hypothetical protein Pan14r_18850 [Crateriforma conspicua]